MLFGLRFLLGAALACLLVAGLGFALIVVSSLGQNTQVSLVAPTPPAPSEVVGPERRQTSGTGGPYVAPVAIPAPDDNAPAPASLNSADDTRTDVRAPADSKGEAVEATASVPTEPKAEPADKPAHEENAPLKEAKREEPDKDTKPAARKEPGPTAKKAAPKPRAQRPRIPFGLDSTATTLTAPVFPEPPFKYFLN